VVRVPVFLFLELVIVELVVREVVVVLAVKSARGPNLHGTVRRRSPA
jgi:hypothetical protein